MTAARARRAPYAPPAAGTGVCFTVPPRGLAEAQAAARGTETTIGFHADYARRAGVEGTMHQAATTSHGARRTRFRGLPKTRLDHVYMACALNLLRLHAYWTGTPLDRRRTSHLARLELGLAAWEQVTTRIDHLRKTRSGAGPPPGGSPRRRRRVRPAGRGSRGSLRCRGCPASRSSRSSRGALSR